MQTLLGALVLTAMAAATAWMSARAAGSRRPVRVASSFVIAAALALPAPAAMVVALAALLVSGGTGLAGAAAPGARALVAGALGALAAQATGVALTSIPRLPAAGLDYLALLATVVSAEWILGGRPLKGRRMFYELGNIVGATVLAQALLARDPVTLLSAAVLLAGGAYALHALASARSGMRVTNDALASRLSELATLHAIGREILSTLDPERIFAIVERECRKIFDVEFFFIGVLDRDTNELRISYRAASDDTPHELLRPMGDGLASWIVREKRPLRIDDVATMSSDLPFRPHMVNRAIRSVIAVPLLVGERVVGVLSVQSRRPSAYDEHHLSVLATIAQQAAVAVENARHYTLATIDSLTGLHLRDYFFRRFEEEYTRAKRYSGAFSILFGVLRI